MIKNKTTLLKNYIVLVHILDRLFRRKFRLIDCWIHLGSWVGGWASSVV